MYEAVQSFLGALDLDPNDDDTIKMFIETTENSFFDAYEAAKMLENKGWTVDKELVDTLDDYFFHINTVQQKAVAEWVERNAITARLKEGDLVQLKHKGAQVSGVIAKIESSHATYTVRVESLGHVTRGQGTHGFIVPFETFHTLVAPVEEFQLTSPPNEVSPRKRAGKHVG